MSMLSEKLENAVEKEGIENSKEVLELLIRKIENVNKSISSRFILMFTLIILFELSITSGISEISFGVFKLTDFNSTQKMLPLLVSYIYCNWTVLYAERRVADEAYDTIFSKIYPYFYNSDIEDF